MRKLILVTPEEYDLVKQYRTGARGVYWSIEDFESRATEVEEWDLESEEDIEYYRKYDRSKFQEAFTKMIDGHDDNIGINWTVIDEYLNIYCKMEKDGDKK